MQIVIDLNVDKYTWTLIYFELTQNRVVYTNRVAHERLNCLDFGDNYCQLRNFMNQNIGTFQNTLGTFFELKSNNVEISITESRLIELLVENQRFLIMNRTVFDSIFTFQEQRNLSPLSPLHLRFLLASNVSLHVHVCREMYVFVSEMLILLKHGPENS